MRLRLVVLAALIVPLAACGTAVAGEPAGADIVVFELSAEVPACGEAEVRDYGPGTVSAYHVDDNTASLTVDGEEVDAEEGDELPARGGTLVVVAVNDRDDGEDTVTLQYAPDGEAPEVTPLRAASAGCPAAALNALKGPFLTPSVLKVPFSALAASGTCAC